MRIILSALGALLIASSASAQQPDSAAIKLQARARAILGIPTRADEIRRSGVPDSAVRTILDILVKEKVPAEEVVVILETERDAVREHGPSGNFGAFVQSQLAAGKRGRELSAAIRAEHAARGKGASAKESKGKKPESPGAKGKKPF